MDPENVQILKLVVVGDSQVGKSSLLVRLTNGNLHTIQTTIAVDFKTHIIRKDGLTIRLQLWDTAGQDRLYNLQSSFYRGADGVLIVFDVCNKESFQHVKTRWLPEVDEFNRVIPKFLIGNKCDKMDERCIDSQSAKGLATGERIQYFETSAFIASTVQEVFTTIAFEIINSKKTKSMSSVERKLIMSLQSKIKESKACSTRLQILLLQKENERVADAEANENNLKKIHALDIKLEKTGYKDQVHNLDEQQLKQRVETLDQELAGMRSRISPSGNANPTSRSQNTSESCFCNSDESCSSCCVM